VTDHVADLAWRVEMLPLVCQLIDLIITDAERARLRRLIASYAPEDPPEDQITACLDSPLFDPRREVKERR
jgi:hypothetical protein